MRVHQFSNDWISVDIVACHRDPAQTVCKFCEHRTALILNPEHCRFSAAAEAKEMKAVHPDDQGAQRFWAEYEVGEDRQLRKRGVST